MRKNMLLFASVCGILYALKERRSGFLVAERIMHECAICGSRGHLSAKGINIREVNGHEFYDKVYLVLCENSECQNNLNPKTFPTPEDAVDAWNKAFEDKLYQIGSVLYRVSNNSIEKCEIIPMENVDNKDFVRVHFLGVVDARGIELCATYGESLVKKSELFPSAAEAASFIEKRENKRLRQYKNGIQNLSDLIAFPVNVSFIGDDGCQDTTAIRAYTERAAEIVGIDILAKQKHNN